MYCKNCGFKLKENSQYCTNCGTKNNKIEIKEKQSTQEENLHSKKPIALVIALSSLVIIFFGGIYFIVANKVDKKDPTNVSKVEDKQEEEIEENVDIDTEIVYEDEYIDEEDKDTTKVYSNNSNNSSNSSKAKADAFEFKGISIEKTQVNKGENIKLTLDTGGKNTRFFKIAYKDEYGDVDEYIFDTYEYKNLTYNENTQKYEIYIDTNNINEGALRTEFIAIQEGEGVPDDTEYEDLLGIVHGEDGADLSYLDVNILGDTPKVEGKVWEGIYNAGNYDRSVKISFLEDNTITFEFGPTENTTHVPYGKYLMKVNSYDENSGELFLEGYEWIEKPDIDWEFAKFKGIIDSNQFTGKAYNTSKNHYLGTFDLERVQ